ncbi:MAG TPA: hypothetical protein ENJ82_10610 [Bacteroidetes bacterium]|nr:hypothetical protein [Bacteroidota bacterium]
MNNILLYVALGLGIVFLVLLILAIAGKGETLRKWLGPIGGLVIAIVAIFGISQAGGGDALKKIREENARLEKELAALNERSEKLKSEHEQEKAAYEAKANALQVQLDEQEGERKELEKKLRDLAALSPMEWLKSLKPDEIAKIKEEINKDIDWI